MKIHKREEVRMNIEELEKKLRGFRIDHSEVFTIDPVITDDDLNELLKKLLRDNIAVYYSPDLIPASRELTFKRIKWDIS